MTRKAIGWVMWTRINMTYDSFPRIFKTKTKAEEVATRWKKRQPKNEPGAVIIERLYEGEALYGPLRDKWLKAFGFKFG